MSLFVGMPILMIAVMVAYYPITLAIMAASFSAYLFLRFKKKDSRAGHKSWKIFGVSMGIWSVCVFVLLLFTGKM